MPITVPILAVLTLGFTLSHFQRTSLSAIAPDLMVELGLSPETFGFIVSGIFIGVAVGQIPIGILLDRYGARRILPIMLAIATVGSLWFAGAHDIWQLFASRFIVGIGVASTLMGALLVSARWFPPDRFAMVSSWVFAIGGGLGNGLGTTPMAAMTEHFGWRWAFVGIAVVTAVIAILIAIVVRDAPPGHPFWNRKPEGARASLSGVLEVVRLPGMWRILVMAMVGYPTLITVLGAWGGPYLADVYGLDAIARGNVLALVALGNVVGFFIFGPLDRYFDTRKGVILGGTCCGIVVAGILALWPHPPLVAAVILLVLFGATAAFSVTNVAMGRATVPERLMGRGVTMVNFATFLGNALLQLVAGHLIGLFVSSGPAPEPAYRLLFVVLALVYAVATLVYLPLPDRKPSAAAKAG
jgi:MFS family permease